SYKTPSSIAFMIVCCCFIIWLIIVPAGVVLASTPSKDGSKMKVHPRPPPKAGSRTAVRISRSACNYGNRCKRAVTGQPSPTAGSAIGRSPTLPACTYENRCKRVPPP
ncbi:unnamed protein product, partial [Ilex paraguariensis]